MKFQFKALDPEPGNRRTHDRRHSTDEPMRSSGRLRKTFTVLAIALIGVGLWKWRALLHGPTFLVRAHWADRSDIYKGRTNGLTNRELVLQARNYLTEVNILDTSGNITPEELRSQGVHVDLEWFKRHHPVSVDFNPFITKGGSFVVTWRYAPGCETSAWKTGRIDTPWYDLQGRPCTIICNVSVLMAPDLRLTSIKIDPAHP